MRTESILIALVTGRCRWCQRTGRSGVEEWSDAKHTLCVPCAELDAVVRTPTGRRLIARLVQPLLDAAARERLARRRARR
jgi:hypothetical protein